MKKNCQQCGKEIIKPQKLSQKQWARKRFCSRKCQDIGRDTTNVGGKNKGIKHPL